MAFSIAAPDRLQSARAPHAFPIRLAMPTQHLHQALQENLRGVLEDQACAIFLVMHSEDLLLPLKRINAAKGLPT